jgi:osmotically-inducible protein OsmY
MTSSTFLKPTLLTAAVVAALSLGACSRHDDNRTAGQKLDSAIANVDQSAHNAKEEAKTAMGDVRSDARNTTDSMGDKVADAAVTASVNADLAKDPDLSALRINVDTVNGHVTLHGTAPTESAKQRATKLASNTKGVTSVDNQLTISN